VKAKLVRGSLSPLTKSTQYAKAPSTPILGAGGRAENLIRDQKLSVKQIPPPTSRDKTAVRKDLNNLEPQLSNTTNLTQHAVPETVFK
jgi:hypothetical protein